MRGGIATHNRPLQAEVRMRKIRIERPEVSLVKNKAAGVKKRPLGRSFLGLLVLTYLISIACLCWVFYIHSKL